MKRPTAPWSLGVISVRHRLVLGRYVVRPSDASSRRRPAELLRGPDRCLDIREPRHVCIDEHLARPLLFLDHLLRRRLALARFPSTSATTTAMGPCSANARAMARPMPLAPPVTTATLASRHPSFAKPACPATRQLSAGSSHGARSPGIIRYFVPLGSPISGRTAGRRHPGRMAGAPRSVAFRATPAW